MLKSVSLRTVLFTTVFLHPSNAFLNQAFIKSISSLHSSHSRSHRICNPFAAVAVAKRQQEKKLVPNDAEEGPEGGWAPPPWKRKITHPLKDLQNGQGPLKGTVRNIEVISTCALHLKHFVISAIDSLLVPLSTSVLKEMALSMSLIFRQSLYISRPTCSDQAGISCVPWTALHV